MYEINVSKGSLLAFIAFTVPLGVQLKLYTVLMGITI